jgi:hypothetical protein
LVLEAFNAVCRGMDDPSFTQIGLISIKIAGIEPRSDLQFFARPPQARPEPAVRQGVHTATKRNRRGWTIVRGLLLWLVGIPLPIILVIWLFGGLS